MSKPRFFTALCMACGKEHLKKARKHQRLPKESEGVLFVCDDCVAHPKHCCGNRMELVRLAQYGNKPFFVCEECEVGYDALEFYSLPDLRRRVEKLERKRHLGER